jgi:tricorn protease-like protein
MRSADRRRRYASLTVILIGACLALNASTPAAVSTATKQKVGNVYQILDDTVLLRGALLTRNKEKAPLYARDVFNTKRGGSVMFKLKLKNATCTLNPGAVLVIRPAKLVATTTIIGNNWCYADRSKRPATFNGGKAKVQVSNDPVFGITVRRNHSAVIKVDRGFVVLVTPKGGRTVLGKKTQVTVSSAGKPQAPRRLQLTKLDMQTIKTVNTAAHLAPPTDTTPPDAHFSASPEPTTPSTDAIFKFVASEPSVIFACSLDGDQFRPCLSPKTFTSLAPGLHTFVAQATDQAGNTGNPVVYSWTIERSASGPIAFESDRTGTFQLYLINSDGTGLSQLTSGPGQSFDADWSPDGTRFAFHSDRGRNTDIYTMNRDGSNQSRLTTDPAIDRNPVWSPDGKSIAFESYRDGGNRDIYVMNATGGHQIRLTTDLAEDLDPDWSPDGTKIAFARGPNGNRQIYVMNADGSGQRRMTTALKADEYNPEWSPDGRKIAFHSNRDGTSEIYVMNADGSNPTRLTTNNAQDYNPTWSPDGTRIAFQSDRDRNTEIYVMHADGSNQTRVTNDPATDQVPDW